MPWHRVDAVVFDIGNILIRYAPKDFLEQLFPGDAQKQQDMLARVYKGPYWERFDRGEMEYAEAARRLAGQFGGDEAGAAQPCPVDRCGDAQEGLRCRNRVLESHLGGRCRIA